MYTCNYGVQKIDQKMQMKEHVSKPREMYATGLVKESRNLSYWETFWYERVFHRDFLTEVIKLKDRHRDNDYYFSLTREVHMFYDYRIYNWDDKPSFKELMCVPPGGEIHNRRSDLKYSINI